jgi:multidrug transporter EmrE-like cation transporter
MKKYFLFIILAAVALEVVADILFKKWSMNGRAILLAVGIGLYIIGTVAWAFSLKFELLTKAISIFTILNLITVALAGLIIFKENLSLTNKIGFVLGLVAIVLIEI